MVRRTTLSSIFGSVLRRIGQAEVTIRSQMVFLVRHRGGPPRFELGPPGRELACYVPARADWTQLNYGQREGQAEIDGREWGFYWQKPDEMAVVLHTGEIEPETAAAFVRAVAEKVAGPGEDFDIVLAGDSYLYKSRG
jgi:hypothetical protein